MNAPDDTWQHAAGGALAQGDLVSAAWLLEAHDAAHSTQPEVAVLFSRMMRLRGRHAQACARLDEALALHPSHAALLVERGQLALELNDPAAAHACFARAWKRADQVASWAPQWIELLMTQGQHDEALRVARAYAARARRDAHAWFWLGYVQQRARRYGEARRAYARCAQLDPHRPMLRSNLAALYLELKDHAAARAELDQALADDPSNALAWNNLALLWLQQGDPGAARVAAERAIVLDAQLASAWQGYSNALKELQEWDEAHRAAARACELAPADPSYRWSLAMLQLVQGHYREGWISHEARWDGSRELRDLALPWGVPRWSGQPLAGKTLLVWSEQGYGDLVQFVRFVPALARRVREAGGALAYCAFPDMLSLVTRSLADQVDIIAPSLVGQIPPHDYHLPLASLPLVLGVLPGDLPRYAPPYLRADPARVAHWQQRWQARHVTDSTTGSTTGTDRAPLRVGLVWSGSRTHQRNPYRAVRPQALGQALAGIAGVRWVSLQVDAPPGELEALREAGLALVDDTPELHSFDETAAYVGSLDLVITVCTSVAHLAGALGVPGCLLLDVNPHWVWMTQGQQSPWYPSLRLYRQPQFGQWAPVLARLARDLRAHVAAQHRLAGTAGTAQQAGILNDQD